MLFSTSASGSYSDTVSRYSTMASSSAHSGLSGSLRLVTLYTPSAFSPAMPMSVFDVQVLDTQVMGSQLLLAAWVRASGQASRVPPLKKAVAPLEARLVIGAATSPAPGA